MYELDVRSICHNALATLSRRPEAYHRKVLAGPSVSGDHCASIHDRVVFKQTGLDRLLRYGRYPRKSLVDHFYDNDVKLSAVVSGDAIERGDFAGGLYEARLRKTADRIQVLLSKQGNAWGIPFKIYQVVLVQHDPITVHFDPTFARWLVFLHTSDARKIEPGPGGFWSPTRVEGQLAEHAADYVMLYQDGTEARAAIRRRHQIGMFQRRWGENRFEAVPHHKPQPRRALHEQPGADWGWSQTRVAIVTDRDEPWLNWLWAWENPYPEQPIAGIRFEPVSGTVILFGLSACEDFSLLLFYYAERIL